MAKLLCSLILVGLVFQVNAVRYTTEHPELTTPDDGIIPDVLTPSYWVNKVIDLLNPMTIVSKITELFNPKIIVSKIVGFLNPLNWLEKIINPLGLLPDVINPVTYIRKAIDLFNPFKLIPNPFRVVTDLIPGLGGDKCKLKVERGSCKEHQPLQNRFYYNHVTKACLPFMYSGCEGNRNNFKSLKECESACKSE